MKLNIRQPMEPNYMLLPKNGCTLGQLIKSLDQAGYFPTKEATLIPRAAARRHCWDWFRDNKLVFEDMTDWTQYVPTQRELDDIIHSIPIWKQQRPAAHHFDAAADFNPTNSDKDLETNTVSYESYSLELKTNAQTLINALKRDQFADIDGEFRSNKLTLAQARSLKTKLIELSAAVDAFKTKLSI